MKKLLFFTLIANLLTSYASYAVTYQCGVSHKTKEGVVTISRCQPSRIKNILICSCHDNDQTMKERFKKLWDLLQQRNEMITNKKDLNSKTDPEGEIFYSPAQLNAFMSHCVSLKKIEAFLAAAKININQPILVKEWKRPANFNELSPLSELRDPEVITCETNVLTIVSDTVIWEQSAYTNLPVNLGIIQELLKRGAQPNTNFVQGLKKQFEDEIKAIEKRNDSEEARELWQQKRLRDAANQILELYRTHSLTAAKL